MSKCPHCQNEVVNRHGCNFELLTPEQLQKERESIAQKEREKAEEIQKARDEFKKFRKPFMRSIITAILVITITGVLAFTAVFKDASISETLHIPSPTDWLLKVAFIEVSVPATILWLWLIPYRRFYRANPKYKELNEELTNSLL